MTKQSGPLPGSPVHHEQTVRALPLRLVCTGALGANSQGACTGTPVHYEQTVTAPPPRLPAGLVAVHHLFERRPVWVVQLMRLWLGQVAHRQGHLEQAQGLAFEM
jgi:hypothetical protein